MEESRIRTIVKAELNPIIEKVDRMCETLHGKDGDRDDLGVAGDVINLKKYGKLAVTLCTGVLIILAANWFTNIQQFVMLQKAETDRAINRKIDLEDRSRIEYNLNKKEKP